MTSPGRYHLRLTVDGHTAADGWWDRRDTADRKATSMIGLYGRDGARITLTDTETGEELRVWP